MKPTHCGNCGNPHTTDTPCVVAKMRCSACGMGSKMPYDAIIFFGSGNCFCGCGAPDTSIREVGTAHVENGHSDLLMGK